MERRTIRRVHYGSLFLFSFIMIAGGVADLIAVPSNVAIFIHLGYPLYVLAMIGAAKLLGALAILYGRPLALKEWAYAGFTFDLVGALISHAVMGDRPQLIFPALLLILLVVSYVAWKRSEASAARNERLET
jgi:DoxX-like family